jgi:hypothetical protein
VHRLITGLAAGIATDFSLAYERYCSLVLHLDDRTVITILSEGLPHS